MNDFWAFMATAGVPISIVAMFFTYRLIKTHLSNRTPQSVNSTPTNEREVQELTMRAEDLSRRLANLEEILSDLRQR
ncbi:MAG: hypothetical protein H6510_10040 [Acidobacteria bacterium]|nr:hypothetical protein [Acidobacteriota bacterium]MCB9398148.1 hypothetical protein [Acidobacteriota bacterium]